jgi:hypothetical protein
VDVVAVLMMNKVYGQSRKVVVCSAHLPYDPAYSSASKEIAGIINYSGKDGWASFWDAMLSPTMLCGEV